MKQNNKNGAFTWAVVFAWVFGIVGVAGVMYMLFTNEDYNGMGGAKFDSSYIAQSDVSSLDSQNKDRYKDEALVPKVADNTPKTPSEKPIVKTIEAPPAKPIVKASEPKEIPPVVKPAPVVAKPAPVVVKPAPVVVKPAPVVVKPAPVVVKPAPVTAKPAPPIVKTQPAVSKPTTPSSAKPTAPSYTATTVKPKPSKPRADKVMSDGELQQLLSRIEQEGDENGIYAKCVQLRGTSGGNNKTALQQIETFLRSKKYSIAGRETTSPDVNGIKITPGNGCMRLTVGSF